MWQLIFALGLPTGGSRISRRTALHGAGAGILGGGMDIAFSPAPASAAVLAGAKDYSNRVAAESLLPGSAMADEVGTDVASNPVHGDVQRMLDLNLEKVGTAQCFEFGTYARTKPKEDQGQTLQTRRRAPIE